MLKTPIAISDDCLFPRSSADAYPQRLWRERYADDSQFNKQWRSCKGRHLDRRHPQ